MGRLLARAAFCRWGRLALLSRCSLVCGIIGTITQLAERFLLPVWAVSFEMMMNETFLEVLSNVSSGVQCWQREVTTIWGRFVTKIHIYTSSYEAGANSVGGKSSLYPGWMSFERWRISFAPKEISEELITGNRSQFMGNSSKYPQRRQFLTLYYRFPLSSICWRGQKCCANM